MNTDMLNEARRDITDVIEEVGAVCTHLREAMDFAESATIIEFPGIRKCRKCSGSGLVWSFQRRTKRPQAASPCKDCGGTGHKRNVEDAEVRKEGK